MNSAAAYCLRLIVLGGVVPLVLSTVVYQGFSTNYTTDVFSEGASGTSTNTGFTNTGSSAEFCSSPLTKSCGPVDCQ